MKTRELIDSLRAMLPEKVDYAEVVGAEGFAYGYKYVYTDPEPYLMEEAADKLEELQNFIDDMLGDHYVDYLEFYANRCRELEEELEKVNKES
jgi:hypothetical protein